MKLLFEKTEIDAGITRVAEEISRDYASKSPVLVGVLKGATIFLSQMITQIKGDVEMDFVTISSYKHGTTSGDLKLVQDLDTSVQGRDVIIVEDIVDSGKTIAFLTEHLRALGAQSVALAVLVDKQRERPFDVPPTTYSALSYENDPFIIGYGFDKGEKFRNLPAIYELEPHEIDS